MCALCTLPYNGHTTHQTLHHTPPQFNTHITTHNTTHTHITHSTHPPLHQPFPRLPLCSPTSSTRVLRLTLMWSSGKSSCHSDRSCKHTSRCTQLTNKALVGLCEHTIKELQGQSSLKVTMIRNHTIFNSITFNHIQTLNHRFLYNYMSPDQLPNS